ncbi:hypothetical protein [Hymenobacter terricola]|uniref:hypothetical protein n=1 Tax=Hymenobacter terricola TaxID=2819236 RepID=UPI001B31567D|nr:hypothetical protein [Hymenobacter terricola]
MTIKKSAPKNFGSLAGNIFSEAQPPQPTESPAKAKLTSFELEADLKLLLDRVVFWEGKKGTQKSVINAALRAHFATNPNAQRPTPDEV